MNVELLCRVQIFIFYRDYDNRGVYKIAEYKHMQFSMVQIINNEKYSMWRTGDVEQRQGEQGAREGPHTTPHKSQPREREPPHLLETKVNRKTVLYGDVRGGLTETLLGWVCVLVLSSLRHQYTYTHVGRHTSKLANIPALPLSYLFPQMIGSGTGLQHSTIPPIK